MRRLLVGVMLGALAVAGLPALADHIQEATIPIERVDLFVGHYATGTRVDCEDGQIGTWPSQFARLRANVYVFSERPDGAPTEHFDVTQTINYPFSGAELGNLYIFDRWGHQNTPPHSADRWQIDSTQIGSVLNKPGMWRIHYLIEGRESGVNLEQECIFEVLETEG